jgi:aryl-alcohol dehydrogenase-like predicted oxidoreductase
VQIIFNLFRVKPAEHFFAAAAAKQVGILARVPLASGLLSGRLKPGTVFPAGDHRNFNRRGEAFDVGETFSGVDYAEGVRAAEELGPLVPPGATLAQFALRWILMFPEVTAAIPGARNAEQAEANVRAAALPPLSADAMARSRAVYDTHFRTAIHARW